MSYIRIAKASWDAGLDKARKAYELIGPVPEKDSHKFDVLNEGQYPDMAYKASKLSPKWVVFPQSETMFIYTLDKTKEDHHILKETPGQKAARAVIGIRPFDAKAIQLTKMNFDTEDYKDPFWLRNYERCTFIGLAANNPTATDFSTSCNTSPFGEEGLDILLVDAGDDFIAKVLSEKGSKFLSEAGFEEKAEAEAAKTLIDGLKTKAEAAISSKVSYNKIGSKTIMDLYEAPFWKDLLFGCINCGTCTYVCPTCWCFDIQDEVKGKDGVRVRNWDSCMTALFTHHASGHNPREYEWERTRQRFMHKLKYFLDKYDAGLMCVGCGRCVDQCPANIDIRTVCNAMNEFEPGK